LTGLEQGLYNAIDPRHEQSWRGRHACGHGVRRWQSSAPFPTAAATAAKTSLSAAQRELTESDLEKIIPGTSMFQGVQAIQ
jgi:hypothetical protein